MLDREATGPGVGRSSPSRPRGPTSPAGPRRGSARIAAGHVGCPGRAARGGQLMAAEGPVEVYAAGDIAEAQFVRGILADAGIEATVVGEPLGAAVGELPPLVATPRVWVRADDAE